MIFHLAPYAIQSGYRVISFGKIDSTNSLAIEFLRNGDVGKLWIVAVEQMAGRARRGRRWISTANNLYATLLLIGSFSCEQAATLGFVAGVSLIEALQPLMFQAGFEPCSLKLKWPNDLLLDSSKLGGMLLEFVSFCGESNGIVIGIGVNVASSPRDLPYPATSLYQSGFDCSPVDLFKSLSQTWIYNYSVWNHGTGLSDIRRKWLRHAANLGREVHIKIDKGTVSGIFETIDRNCHFVLRKSNKQKMIISAGDVHFGSVASIHAKP